MAAVDDARDRTRGCLLGGAIGDALGAPIEFESLADIRRRDPAGVTGYLPAYGRRGAITDDTQMTLFTAEGVIRAVVRFAHRGIAHGPSVIERAYGRWLVTQDGEHAPDALRTDRSGWLVGVDELHHRRAPGATCLAALRAGTQGSIEHPINGSKGCGGVMRVAPIGLTAIADPFRMGADAAALTHGHPSGYLAAGVLASTVHQLFRGASLDGALDHATDELVGYEGHGETLAALHAARDLASAGRPSPEQLEALGGGWVAEEALAIGVCCALVATDVRDGLVLAVNHAGDSDSTGSIAGNLLGVAGGESSLPADLLADLELRDVITTVADDLADACWGAGVGGEYEEIDDRVAEVLRRYPGF